MAITSFICVTCGLQHAPSEEPPPRCIVCEDDRQYVPAAGQRWTTLDELRRTHTNRITPVEPGLWSIRSEPAFAIHHNGFAIETGDGLVLWDTNAVLDDRTVASIHALGRGPVRGIAISHPHFYTTMVEWSRAFDGAPVYVHAADASWLVHRDDSIVTWSGTTHALPGDITLIRTGGHFPGSQALHWPHGAEARGALFVGDDPSVCADRRHVTFMHSFPNAIPLGAVAAEAVTAALRPFAFDRVYGWRPDLVIDGDAKACVERSLVRHTEALAGRLHAT